MDTKVTVATVGALPDGSPLREYMLENRAGVTARVLNFGAILSELWLPGRDGRRANVVLGRPRPIDFVADNPFYFGAVCGRYANRIGGARFTLEGVAYELAANCGPHQLHGGPVGFSKVLWEDEPLDDGVRLRLVSSDGDQGYPGTLTVELCIHLTADSILRHTYSATCDRPTVLNLTAHPYFNLAGHAAGTIRGHRLRIAARRYLLTDIDSIPTGELAPVEGSPFDLRDWVRLGDRLDDPHPHLVQCRGFDHCFAFAPDRDAAETVARLEEPMSGRWLEIATDQPAVQLYTGNFLDDRVPGYDGSHYAPHSGLCLETQHFPNAPNEPRFPSTVLRPGETFATWTEHRLGWG
jgi:aldose 1-epimerase